MSGTNDPNLAPGDDATQGATRPPSGYAIESDAQDGPDAPAAPRRAASATFVVDSRPGDEAAMRAAMDPANQSLGEALRLSYRLLQVVILALIVLFIFSGFQTVREGFTGVRTLFGRIYGTPGQEQLDPGFTPFWPYPVGEIITMPVRRTVDLERSFFPTFRNPGITFDQAVESATISEMFRPGTDGYVLSAGGDIVHLQLNADYTIDDAVKFLENVNPASADLVVRRVLQRAVVHAAARLATTELVDSREEPIQAVQEEATRTLASINSGLALAEVRIPLRTVALAVRREMPGVVNAREDARAAVERAREEAERILNGVAGRRYPELIAAINRYEQELQRGENVAAEESFVRLGALLESSDVTGEASLIISRARSVRTKMESTLGNEYQRFASILPAWRRDPELVVRRLWLETYSDVLGGDLIEVFNVAPQLSDLMVRIKSSDTLMQDRRRADLERRKRDFAAEGLADGPYLLRGRDTPGQGGRAGRRLERTADVGFGKDR